MDNPLYNPEIKCEQKCIQRNCYILKPFLVKGEFAQGEFKVPLVTSEVPLIPAINRGRSISYSSGGIETKILKDEMTRAPLITTDSERTVNNLVQYIKNNYDTLKKVAESTTKFGQLTSLDSKVYKNDLYLRVGMFCGDAAGHNMTEKASIAISKFLEEKFLGKVSLFSISSNYCTDKKPALVNLMKGRGKSVQAKVIVPEKIVRTRLKTTAEDIVNLNYKKNYIGSKLAGTLGGNNSHFGNMVAAIFSATGQDNANVTEGSMGITKTEKNVKGDLYFSIEMPCLIVGTIGGGTKAPYAKENLELLECYGSGNPPGFNAKKFAEIISAVVLSGELSTMAELTKGGKFIDAHNKYERNPQVI